MAQDADTKVVVLRLLAASETMRQKAHDARKAGKQDMFDYLMKKSAQYKDQAISLRKLGER